MTVRLTPTCDQDRAAESRALLGATINHVFGASLSLAAMIGREQLSADVAAHLYEVIETLDRAATDLRVGVEAFAAPPAAPAEVIDLCATSVLVEFAGPVDVTEDQTVVAWSEIDGGAPLVVGRVRRVASGRAHETYVALEFEEGLSAHAWRLVQALEHPERTDRIPA